jgi:hypothetical protein
MVVSGKEAFDIVFEHEDYEEMYDKIVGTTRWSEQHEVVVRQLPTGKFYKVFYSCGKTEQQDEQPFEFDKEVRFVAVAPMEKIIIVYEKINNQEEK